MARSVGDLRLAIQVISAGVPWARVRPSLLHVVVRGPTPGSLGSVAGTPGAV